MIATHDVRQANRSTRWVFTVVVLVVLPILVSLGFWQLDRADQKRRLQEEYDRRAHDAPIRITGRQQPVEELRFYKVEAVGRYEERYQVLLDNRVHNGRAGYYVLTPLRLEGSEVRVLVNRGWIPLGRSRQELPQVPTEAGLRRVHGVATVPLKHRFRLGEPVDRRIKWSPVWQYLDLDRYQAAVPFSIQPVVILLDPEVEAGGFVRQWKRLDAGIAVHQGYAFQWFSLAVALMGIYLFLMLRPRRKPEA